MKAIGVSGLRPVIDRVFGFDEALEAKAYVERNELLGKVVDAKVCAVRTKLLSRDSQLDRLLQDIARGARHGSARCVPMTEGEEADLLHGPRSSFEKT